MKLTREKILAINRHGMRYPDDMVGYYTPALQIALELGQRGIDLSVQPTVTGYRYGTMPEGGLSYNYADDRSERGLSLAAIDGQDEVGSSVWFAGRAKVTVTGLLLPYQGSDGEPLVLPYDVDDMDSEEV